MAALLLFMAAVLLFMAAVLLFMAAVESIMADVLSCRAAVPPFLAALLLFMDANMMLQAAVLPFMAAGPPPFHTHTHTHGLTEREGGVGSYIHREEVPRPLQPYYMPQFIETKVPYALMPYALVPSTNILGPTPYALGPRT
eukprot:1459025-Rhodomonas_salina.1